MQNWKDLYLEQAYIINEAIPEILWIDLWHNQVNFLEDEHPFPTPALFLSYRTLSIKDEAQKVQEVNLQVDVRLFYETFSDTYHNSVNQQSALEFLDILNKIHAVFHGSNGTNYSKMRRLSFAPEDTGNAGNLYRISFECTLIDYGAIKKYDTHEIKELDINRCDDPYQIDIS